MTLFTRTSLLQFISLTIILLTLPKQTSQIPIPEDPESTENPKFSPPPLIVLPDDEETHPPSQNEDQSQTTKQKRDHHSTTPSPEELESKRAAFITALGGGEDSAPVLLTSLQGLGDLATDFVQLIGTNTNETLGPLREARKRARENFPDIGSNINRIIKNGRAYTTRAYRSLIKNLRVKLTNILRFSLQAVTRLASTVGGIYQVVVSLLDVATRGIGTGARVGANLLAVGSNASVRALAKGTQVIRNLADSGVLVKPANQAVMIGRGLAKGVTEDLFDKVEWAQEGLNAKLELAQALAPNFLLRAHENTHQPPSITTDNGNDDTSYDPPPPSDSESGGYSKLHDEDDHHGFLYLASMAVEKMQRDGRGIDVNVMLKMMKMNGTDSPSTTTEKEETTTTTQPTTPTTTTQPTTPKVEVQEPTIINQTLLNDIFGLQDEVDKLKEAVGSLEVDDGKVDEQSSTVKSS